MYNPDKNPPVADFVPDHRMEPIGDLMPVGEYATMIDLGLLKDEDGHGYPSNGISFDIRHFLKPSYGKAQVPVAATHVLWVKGNQ